MRRMEWGGRMWKRGGGSVGNGEGVGPKAHYACTVRDKKGEEKVDNRTRRRLKLPENRTNNMHTRSKAPELNKVPVHGVH